MTRIFGSVMLLKSRIFFCIFAKIFASIIGLLSIYFHSSPYIQAASIGVLPIWFEVFSCYFLKIEPARETNAKILLIDAIVDAWCFLILPPLWLIHAFSFTVAEYLTLILFTIAGLYRLHRFLKTGLKNGQFEGLPVTYTGYFWIIAVFLLIHDYNSVVIFLLIGLSFAMITKRIKINPSQ
jgi:hypothetical protein